MKKMNRKSLGVAAGLVLAAATLALGAAVVLPRAASAHGGFGMFGARGGAGGDVALAEALGITAEELQAAHEKAREAALDQAVDKGLLTEDQAEALKDGTARGFGKGGFGMGGRGMHGMAADIDKEALLAGALGISVESLQDAQGKAFEASIKAALDADRITETQAEAARARYALGQYLREQGVEAKARTVYEDAVKGAVSAGVLTQEQADQLQSGPGLGGFGHGGFGGRGMHRGGFGGPGFGRGFEDRAAPGTEGSGNSNGTAGPAAAPSGFDL